MRLLVPAAALSVVLLLAGCGSPATPKATPPAAGTCLDAQNGADSDWTSVVDCTAPHYYDVLGSGTWRGMADAVKADGADKVYAGMADGTYSQFDTYKTWAEATCTDQFRSAIGIDDIAYNGVSASSMSMLPGGNYYVDYSLASKGAFEAGTYTTLCSIAWVTAEGRDLEKISFDKGVGVKDMLTAAFPASLRACYSVTDAKTVDIDCAKPHDGQYLMFFDGMAALGADWIASVDPQTQLAPDYTAPDDFCLKIAQVAYTGIPSSPLWYPFTDVAHEQSPWKNWDGTVDPKAKYPMYCGAYPNVGAMLVGDVVDGSVNVE